MVPPNAQGVDRTEMGSVRYEGGVAYLTLPEVNIDRTKNQTNPNVANINLLVCENTTNITISNFRFGAQGQLLRVLGDGNTRVDETGNIRIHTGTTKLLQAEHIYRFTCYNNIWYEDA